MNAAMWTAKTGVQAQDAKLQAIANNLANVNTTGFKRDRVVFEDLFYQVERQPGAAQAEGMNTPVGVQLGNGVRVAGTQKVFTTGSLQTTGQPLDIAIQGQGFLQVELPSGETAYTRAGNLHLSGQGQLVTADGYQIEPQITIPENAVTVMISKDGIVSVKLADQDATQQVGNIELANFQNPAGLMALGGNLFSITTASATRRPAFPAPTASARWRRASSKTPTSAWSKRWST